MASSDALEECRELVIATQFGSTSMLQRRLRLPHQQVIQIMERLEREGVVGPRNPDGYRDVLVKPGGGR